MAHRLLTDRELVARFDATKRATAKWRADGKGLSAEGLVDAQRGADEYGVRVAAHYSAWYTDYTTRALIGRGLAPENASRYGFIAVAPVLDVECGK